MEPSAATSLLLGRPAPHRRGLSLGAIPTSILCGTPWFPDKPYSPRTRPHSLSFEESHTTHVYLAFHATTGYSPLHQAVNHGVHRLSLSLLHTPDHVSCTSHLICDTLDGTQARPKSQAVLLMGIFRAVWDHRSSLSDTLLVFHLPDPAKVPPVSPSIFSSEVTEWLHAQVQLVLSPLVSMQHTA